MAVEKDLGLSALGVKVNYDIKTELILKDQLAIRLQIIRNTVDILPIITLDEGREILIEPMTAMQ